MFMTVRDDALGENYVLQFCSGTYSEVTGQIGGSRSNQFIRGT